MFLLNSYDQLLSLEDYTEMKREAERAQEIARMKSQHLHSSFIISKESFPKPSFVNYHTHTKGVGGLKSSQCNTAKNIDGEIAWGGTERVII